MNSKERILTALNHEEPDQVPLDVWLPPQVGHKLHELLCIPKEDRKYGFSKRLGHDLLKSPMTGVCEGFGSIDLPERKVGENLYQDKFGIQWRRAYHAYGSYCEFAVHPLADQKAYDSYVWPDPLAAEQEALEGCRELVAAEGRSYAIMGSIPCTIFESAWYLRGLENLLMDICANRDFAEELLERSMRYGLEVSKQLALAGVDILWWGDDIAHERGPLIRPADFRALIKSRYAYMAQEVRKINKDIKIAFHSDGKVEWALDDLVEMGVDILNPLQPDVNDVAMVKKRYGKKLSFWGNVDTRVVMTRGSAEDVVEEVKKVLRTLSPGGGHIFCSNHGIQDGPKALENVLAFYWAFNQFKRYPIRV
jgi:uroporphyrinogen decarboxylase